MHATIHGSGADPGMIDLVRDHERILQGRSSEPGLVEQMRELWSDRIARRAQLALLVFFVPIAASLLTALILKLAGLIS